VVRALGAQAVGRGERAVDVARVHRADRGQLVHDDLRPGGRHRREHRLAVERVGHYRLGAELAQPAGLVRRAGHPDDGMAGLQQQRHQLAAERARRAREEDPHESVSLVEPG